jgi:hypothetical protein
MVSPPEKRQVFALNNIVFVKKAFKDGRYLIYL